MNKFKEILAEKGNLSSERKDPIEHLLKDEAVSEIFINSPDEVYSRRDGKVVKEHTAFDSSEHAAETVERLRESYKVAKIPTTSGFCATITKKQPFLTMKQLIEAKTLTKDIYGILQPLVQGRANIIISGAPNTGKSTLLNALLGESVNDRIVVIDPKKEIEERPNLVILEEPKLEYATALRTERIALNNAEDQITDAIGLMTRGYNCMLTIDAGTHEDAIARIKLMVAKRCSDHEVAAKMVQAAIDIIIHLERRVDGKIIVARIGEYVTIQGRHFVTPIVTKHIHVTDYCYEYRPSLWDEDIRASNDLNRKLRKYGLHEGVPFKEDRAENGFDYVF